MDIHLTVSLQSPAKRHRFGVTALAFSKEDGGNILYSAGRDGTVRGYDLKQSHFSCDELNVVSHTVLSEHDDWVNDILVFGKTANDNGDQRSQYNEDRIASASSDSHVKIWHPLKGCLQTLSQHTDYVKALAQTREHDLISGGLDRQLLVWDIETGKCTDRLGEDGVTPKSIYTLHADASNPTTTAMLASGIGKDVVLWDVRTAHQTTTLRAHSDMVRVVHMCNDGHTLLSGASDNDIALHDARMPQTLRVYALHDDSVWALCATEGWHSFYSGGRDGSVFHCDLGDGGTATQVKKGSRDTGESRRHDMVLAVAAEPADDRFVWVSTTGSDIRQYAVRGSRGTPRSIRDVIGLACRYAAPDTPGSDTTRNSPSHAREETTALTQALANGNGKDDGDLAPTACIEGEAGIIQANCLNDRRYIITRDMLNTCQKFDVLTGRLVHTYAAGVSVEEALSIEMVEVSVPPWFTCELKKGALEVRISAPMCFQSDVYASDVGLADAESAGNDRINLAELFLHNVFQAWKGGRSRRECARRLRDLTVKGDDDANGESKANAKEGDDDRDNGDNGGDDDGSESESDEEERKTMAYLETLSTGFVPYGEVSIFRKGNSSPIASRLKCSDAAAMQQAELPAWVTTAITRGRRRVKGMTIAPAKVSFTLDMLDGRETKSDGMKLTAPRFLRISKVKDYIISQLDEVQRQGVHKEHVTVWCKETVLADSMGIATCAQFVWGRSDCLKLGYTIDT